MQLDDASVVDVALMTSQTAMPLCCVKYDVIIRCVCRLHAHLSSALNHVVSSVILVSYQTSSQHVNVTERNSTGATMILSSRYCDACSFINSFGDSMALEHTTTHRFLNECCLQVVHRGTSRVLLSSVLPLWEVVHRWKTQCRRSQERSEWWSLRGRRFSSTSRWRRREMMT